MRFSTEKDRQPRFPGKDITSADESHLRSGVILSLSGLFLSSAQHCESKLDCDLSVHHALL